MLFPTENEKLKVETQGFRQRRACALPRSTTGIFGAAKNLPVLDGHAFAKVELREADGLQQEPSRH